MSKSKSGDPMDTPMMRQYQRIKAEVGDAVLFFRLGDFYEMFHDDAVRAARVLDITLTARGRDSPGGGYPMCGVPHHAADGYVARLVAAGHRVAICDQVEDPRSAKGVVKREVVRIVTPGTAMDERNLSPQDSSFVTAVLIEKARIGLAHVDATTGEFRFSEHEPERDREALLAELATFAPRELLVSEECDREAVEALWSGTALPTLTEVDPWSFSRQHAVELIAEHYRVAGLGAYGLDGRPAATRAVGATLAYLRDVLRADLGHLEPPRVVDAGETVGLDPTTRRNLELFANLRDGSRSGTLLSVLDRTATAMGGRTLKDWLARPLSAREAIDERLDAVEDFLADARAGTVVSQSLEAVGDLERLLSRVVLGSANARDLVAVASSLAVLPKVRHALSELRSRLCRRLAEEIDPLGDLREKLDAALVDNPPATIRDGGMIREGWSEELDELRSIARDARTHLAKLEARERERTGIGSLKIRHNKVFGYYIEVSKSNLEKVPEDYQRKQTLATGERYVIPELKELESKILHAQERSIQLEGEMFVGLREAVAEVATALRTTARAVAVVDVLQSFAAVARSNTYVRPVIDESTALAIRAGRHPVVEQEHRALAGPGLGDGRFVPNDTQLDASEHQLVILTGPNMGGKSTYLRQVALITLMAQVGSFVPAESARIGLVDKIFTRVGASDSLATGESTFMVEMNETARILHEATSRSLIVLDEIGRGTATFDGLSIAWAVAEFLHETETVAARTLFATHYHELTELAVLYPRVKNYRLATREWNDEIIFLHRVEPGAGDRSYGIQVARLAGLPREVVARAREVLQNLERNDLDPSGRPRLAEHGEQPAAARPVPEVVAPQLPLFGEPVEDPALRELADRLAHLEVDELAPRRALDLLADLSEEARRLSNRRS